LGILVSGTIHSATVDKSRDNVEQWGIFELSLEGPSSGNPFVDVNLSAKFKQNDRVYEPEGFYDGDGIYRIRFMPDNEGEWTFITKSNIKELDGKRGKFNCIKPQTGNHGPVRVYNTFYFRYADGTPYFQIGTTCYAWTHQGYEMEEQTLETLILLSINCECVFSPKIMFIIKMSQSIIHLKANH